MAEYTSKPVTLTKSADAIYDTLTDLSAIPAALGGIPSDSMDDEQRRMVDGIRVEGDSITIPGGPTGDITLVKSSCTRPVHVSFEGVGTPVPVTLGMRIQPLGDDASEVTVEAKIQVPAMLKPMLNGPMQKMVDEVAQNLHHLNRQ